MNSTASAVMACAAAGRATINSPPRSRPGPWRGDAGHGVIGRSPVWGVSGDRVTASRGVVSGAEDGTAGARFPGRWFLHLFVHQLIHRGCRHPPSRVRTPLGPPLDPQPGRVGEAPAVVLAEGQARVRIVGKE